MRRHLLAFIKVAKYRDNTPLNKNMAPASGLAFGEKLEAVLNAGKISHLLLRCSIEIQFTIDFASNIPCCLLVSEEIKFWNTKGGPGTRLGAGWLCEFYHAKQSAKWQEVPNSVRGRKSSEKVKHIVRNSVLNKTGKQTTSSIRNKGFFLYIT